MFRASKIIIWLAAAMSWTLFALLGLLMTTHAFKEGPWESAVLPFAIAAISAYVAERCFAVFAYHCTVEDSNG